MKRQRLIAFLLVLVMLFAMALPANAAGVNGYYNADYLEDYAAAAYGEENLGAAWTKDATTFKVWSPNATRVQLRLYKTGSDEEKGAGVIGTYGMTMDPRTGVWSVKLSGDYKNVYYTYFVTARGETRETRDVYAKAAGVNGYRSMVVDLDATDPADWDKDRHVLNEEATDAVIWEVHVRDFSISPSSGVSAANRGKYLAFTENNTTLDGKSGEVSTCVSYLKEMGVNTVHLLPVYDFGSVDETITDDSTNRNWGYDPINYNVPEGSYSTNPYDGNVRIKEFKQMVKALHEAGISVVMDVVYNHTYDVDSYEWGARLLYNNAFNDTVPGYYHRRSDAAGWYNGSGCGNVTASDKLMYRKYMVESVLYWATEYHIDGFRFDLMGCHDVDTMNLIRSELDKLDGGEGQKILMYGEPWTGGDAGIANGATQNGAQNYRMNERIALFCDWMRDSIKGNPDGDTTGWIQGNTDGNKTDAIWGGINANDGRLTARSQTVTYADAHDNLILWDKIVKSNGGTKYDDYSSANAKLWLKQLRLAETILMVSQGLQFQVAGTEFARNKQGDHNSYKSPDNVNAIDWSVRKTNADSADYYKGLIAIRKAFSPFTDPTNQYTKNPLEGADDNCIAYWVPNTAAGEWTKVAVVLNNSGNDKTVTLPAGEWTVLANGEQAGTDGFGTASGTYTVHGFTGVILAQGSYIPAPKRVAYTGSEKLYVDLGAVEWWCNDGAVTKAYYFNDSANAWSAPMTQAEGTVYSTTVPAGDWTKVILVRLDPAKADGWDGKWNQTGDIALVDGKNYIKSFADGSADVTWDTYGGTTPVEPEPGTSSYYLVGSFSDWAAQEAYRLSSGANAGEYVLKGVTLPADAGVKVYDNTKNVWYPDGMGNDYTVTEAGSYDVSFYPAGGHEGYHEGFFQLTKVGGGSEPQPTTSSYYLVGGMTDWAAKPGYQLHAGTNAGEYVLENVSLTTGTGVKVKDETNNKWYPDGMGNDYLVVSNGIYSVSFYPAGGQAGYHEGFFLLTKTGDAPVIPIDGDGRTFADGEKLYVNVMGGPQATDEVTGEMAPWWDKYSPIHKMVLTASNGATVTVTMGLVEDKGNERVYQARIPAGNYVSLVLERWGDGEAAPYNTSDSVEIPATGNYLKDFPYEGKGEALWDTYDGPAPADHSNAKDAVILHCWCWSYQEIIKYLPQIKAAGYTAVQTSPAQVPKNYSSDKTNVQDWWMLYQPVSFSIAPQGTSWLGGKEDLTKLCTEAHKLGLEVIVDVVANHMSNGWDALYATAKAQGKSDAEAQTYADSLSPVTPDPEIKKYEPEIYNGNYFRDYVAYDDYTTLGVTRGNIGMPDLRTESRVVQDAVADYLVELVDVGVDGFRFDAVKHIETPYDGEYASDFWPIVLKAAENEAAKKNKDIWYYGEIFMHPGGGRFDRYYTQLKDSQGTDLGMAITDFAASGASLWDFNNDHNVTKIASLPFMDYPASGDTSRTAEPLERYQVVLFPENHDQFTGDAKTYSFSVEQLNKTWAIETARADVSTLYFARPQSYKVNAQGKADAQGTMGKCESFDWQNTEVAAVNQVHNDFVGGEEACSAFDNFVIIERYNDKDAAAVVVNSTGTVSTLTNAPVDHLPDGEYYEQITDEIFTVSNGKLSGKIGATGIAVLRSASGKCEHAHTTVKTTQPTCTEPGYKMTYCTDCGRLLSKEITAPALGHVDANNDGHCDRCGEYLKNVTVYFVDTNRWVAKGDDFTTVNLYAFDAKGGENKAWPGEAAECVGKTTEGFGIWMAQVNPEKYDKIIFNNGVYQTNDLSYLEDKGTASYVVYTAEYAAPSADGRTFSGSELLYLNAAAVEWWRNDGAILRMTLTKKDGTTAFVDLDKVDGDVYGAKIPAGTYVSLVLSRVNPSDQSETWNATGSITIPAAGDLIERFADGSSEAAWAVYGTASGDKVNATPGAVLSEICGHTAYEIVRYYDQEAKVCDCCGKHFDVVEVAADAKAMLFEDVQNPSDYFTTPVYWAVAAGITTGTSATRFSPSLSCTRAQVVTFLWRAAGSPAPAKSGTKFTDVPDGSWYTEAVNWAVAKGITTGVGNGKFDPNAPCTRAQIVTFLYRYAESPKTAKSDTKFSDVPDGSWYADAVNWAVAKGVTTGTGGSKFSPTMVCSRAQVVTFLYRMVQSTAK